jgi:hypothetical protein
MELSAATSISRVGGSARPRGDRSRLKREFERSIREQLTKTADRVIAVWRLQDLGAARRSLLQDARNGRTELLLDERCALRLGGRYDARMGDLRSEPGPVVDLKNHAHSGHIHGLIGRFVIQTFVGSSGTGEMACRWKLAPDGYANFSLSLLAILNPQRRL